MRYLSILFVAGALLLACSSDDPGPALSTSAYTAQGNGICDGMNAELDALSRQASAGDLSPEEERDLFIQANTISRDAIDALFDLSPPESLVDERESLLALVEERRQLIDQASNGTDVFDEITEVNERFEAQARAIWPSCTT